MGATFAGAFSAAALFVWVAIGAAFGLSHHPETLPAARVDTAAAAGIGAAIFLIAVHSCRSLAAQAKQSAGRRDLIFRI